MKNHKVYEANDKMITLIRDNYNVLQSLGSFGVNLGFGDKTVQDICEDHGVDTYTFLAVVNFTMNGDADVDIDEKISVPTLLHYLKASHEYYLGFQLPFIRRELDESIDNTDRVGRLIMKLYDEYAGEIHRHMQYEEDYLFPYVDKLLNGETSDYNVQTFADHHDKTDEQLRELKSIIIQYLPSDSKLNNKLTATLYDIYNNEEWLRLHSQVEEKIFVPAIRLMEDKVRQQDVAKNISSMVMGATDNVEALSDRETDVVICIVQGMSNKEIADKLFISVNTVITHRRNIARKLQIHSTAGLTIYAIVNGLVDISSVNL